MNVPALASMPVPRQPTARSALAVPKTELRREDAPKSSRSRSALNTERRKERIALITQAFKYRRMFAEKDDPDMDYIDSDKKYWKFTAVTSLLVGQDNRQSESQPCQNATRRDSFWSTEPPYRFAGSDMGVLSQIAHVCYEARLRKCECEDHRCERSKINDRAPQCETWIPFREWAITAITCQYAMENDLDADLESEEWMEQAPCLSPGYAHIGNAINALCNVIKGCNNPPTKPDMPETSSTSLFRPYLDGDRSDQSVDLNSVMDLIFWMAKTQGDKRIGPKTFGHWTDQTLPSHISFPSIETAFSKIETLGVCKYRLWKLIDKSDRKEADLPSLVMEIQRHKANLAQDNHIYCIADKCYLSHGSTEKVKQLHKCDHGSEQCDPGLCNDKGHQCCPIKFPMEQVVAALEQDASTAWKITDKSYPRLGASRRVYRPKLSGPGEKHLAISHVWNDGTGAVNGDIGCVNPCLLDFFSVLARNFSCQALWWDVISIPEGDDRAKALNQMHYNFGTAEATLVHDTYLLSIPWKEDGSPCLALVLSSWFSRGWTALELAMSKKVKILFKRPEEDPRKTLPYVVKDLDDDVLAKSPATSSRAYWLATGMIRELRKQVDNVGDLLAILSPRSTSYVSDRTKIAALLAGVPNCDLERSEGEITMDIVKYLGKVPQSCLLHGKPTIRHLGDFSWCTSTLEAMPVDTSRNFGDTYETYDLTVNEKGRASGPWGCRMASDSNIRPYGDNLSTITQIKVALENRDSLLLLQPLNMPGNRRLLVKPTGIKERNSGPLLQCQYVGAVLVDDNTQIYANDKLPEGTIICRVRIGSGMVPKSARGVMKKLIEQDPGEMAFEEGDESETDGSNDETNLENRNRVIQKPAEGGRKLTSDSRLFDWLEGAHEPDFRGSILGSTLSDPLKPSGDDLLEAVLKKNKDAAKWLVRNKISLTDDKLEDLLKGGQAFRNGKKLDLRGLNMLGDILIEQREYEEAARILGKAWEKYNEKGIQVFSLLDKYRTAYSLGRTLRQHNIVGQRHDSEDPEALWNVVVEACDNKRAIYMQEHRKKRDQAEALEARNKNRSHSISRILTKNPEANEKITTRDANWTQLLLNTVAELAMMYVSQHRFQEASRIYARGLEEIGQSGGNRQAFQPFEMDWLERQTDTLTQRRAKNECLMETYEKALKDFNVRFRQLHALVALTSLHLAVIYHHSADHGTDDGGSGSEKSESNLLRAEKLLKKAEEGLKLYLNKKPHFVLAMSQYHLGKVYAKRGKYEDALRKLDEALVSVKMLEGRKRPGYGSHRLLFNIMMAKGFTRLDKGEAARSVAEEFIGIMKQLQYESKVEEKEMACLIAESFLGIAAAMLRGQLQAQVPNAERCCLDAIKKLNSVFSSDRPGKNHPSVIQWCDAHATLARVYLYKIKLNRAVKAAEKAKELDLALEAAEKAYKGFCDLSGRYSLAACKVSQLLGEINKMKGLNSTKGVSNSKNLERAALCLEEAFKGYRSILGLHHEITLEALANLGRMKRHQEAFKSARKFLSEAKDGFQSLLGPESAKVKDLEQELGEFL